MKKIYTLLAAAAVTVSASAIDFQKADKSISVVEFDSLNKIENVAKKNFTVVAKDENAVKPLASSYPVDPTGNYFFRSSFNAYDGAYAAAEFEIYEDMPLGQGYFVMGNMFGWFAEDIDVLADLVSIRYTDGTTGYALLADNSPIYKNQYCLEIIGRLDGKLYSVEDEEMLFPLDEETGAISMPEFDFSGTQYAGMEIGLALVNAAGSGYFFPDMTFYAANGKFSWNEYSGGTYSPIEYNVHGYQKGAELSIINFAETPYLIVGDIDLETGEVAFVDQLAAGEPLWSYDFPWYTVIGEDIYYDMYGYIENNADGKTSTLTIEGEPIALADGVGYFARGKDTVINFNFTIEGLDAGVEDVIADDSNAPVEYFNLQGVRVAKPANGLYIVRQGNKVTKQVIR